MNKLWLIANYAYKNAGGVGRPVELLYQWLFQNAISAKAKIGDGTVFMHHGLGVAVHQNAIIGENCRVFQNVTIGTSWAANHRTTTAPCIGNNVMIGAGAAILGEVHIGDNCIIGANAVVIADVPNDSVAIGVPAKYKAKRN